VKKVSGVRFQVRGEWNDGMMEYWNIGKRRRF
jgi:hypothetical protein